MLMPAHHTAGQAWANAWAKPGPSLSQACRLFLEDELHEGGVQVITDVLVFLLLGNELVWTFTKN